VERREREEEIAGPAPEIDHRRDAVATRGCIAVAVAVA
jgi:hypothetical protein